MKRIEDYVISIPDFPEPGIIFRDITGILRDADGLKLSIDKIQEMLEGVEFDAVLGLESRGFIFGMPIAYNLHKAFIPVRKKGKLPRETVSAKYDLEYGTDAFAEIADISVADCFEIASVLCKEFRQGTFGHVELCYTRFVSILTQNPESVPVLPLIDIAKEEQGYNEKERIRNLILYEPNGVEVFNSIVPEYLGGLIYGGVCESVASELAARRNAMEKATGNAQDMIDELNLYYNRERQAGITQEITEIVGGAECL